MMRQKSRRRSLFPVRLLKFVRFKRLVYLALFVPALILFAVFSSRGLMQIYQLKAEQQKVRAANLRLQEENRRLKEQVQKLHNNKQEVEKVIREEMGLVKKGEVVYQFEK